MVLGTVMGLVSVGSFGLYELRINLIEDRQLKTKHVVESVHEMLRHYPTMVANGAISLEQAQKMALADLRHLRYDEHEYFWATDDNSTLLMHPFRADLVGKNLTNFEDPKGKRFFAEMTGKATTTGEGFVSYYWPKPGSDVPVAKISFVKAFEPWNWIIGTGIYIDDVDAIFWQEAKIEAIVGGIILAIVIAVTLLIAHGITQPLSFVTADMRKLAEGKLEIATKEGMAGGEVGDLMRAITVFRESIMETERLRKEQESLKIREEKTLRENEARFRTIAETIPMPLAICGAGNGEILFANQLFKSTFGDGDQALEVLNINQVIDSEKSPTQALELVGRHNILVDHQVTARKADGSTLWVSLSAQHITFMEKPSIVFSLLDISRRKKDEDELRKLSVAMEQSPASIMITDTKGIIEYVNPKFEEVSGYSEEEIIGQKPNVLHSGHTPRRKYTELWENILSGKTWRGEFHNKHKDSTLYWELASISPITSSEGNITHFLAVKEDITERKNYEKKLLHQANFDSLTELPNRLLAMDRLAQALARAKRLQWRVALLFIDLDDFKKINDTLGHEVGDKHLKEIGKRLKSTVREADTVARLGGDEFLVIIADLSASDYTETVAQKVLDAISKPIEVDGHELYTTASIGITLYPDDGEESQVLLRNADAAMYRAKETGRDTYHYFTPEMNEQAMERLTMEAHLRHALERDELKLHYQPINDLANGEIIGAEALLRWNNPKFGNVSPAAFIPLAEETGLIIPIGDWVLETACEQANTWHEQSSRPFRIAVNAAFPQFRGGRLVKTIERILNDTGLTPESLELEITERLLMEDELESAQALNELNEMGVKLSIDDFGTGYSALSYLKRFPVDTLKIDQRFVRDVTNNTEDAALTSAIIAMAHSLGLKVVGEGVEQPDQLAFLKNKKCDQAQGFHFSRPVPSSDFTQILEDRSELETGKKLG